jgi:hypothetical protein
LTYLPHAIVLLQVKNFTFGFKDGDGHYQFARAKKREIRTVAQLYEACLVLLLQEQGGAVPFDHAQLLGRCGRSHQGDRGQEGIGER